MPAITPDSPGEYAVWDGQVEHVRQHRRIEAVLEGLDTSISTGQLASGSATVGTSSTAAPIKGFYRTAAVVAVAVPSMSTNSVTSKVFSVAAQMGNAIQPGDVVQVLPQTDWPAAVVQGNAYCVDTNSITIWWRSISGINATTSVNVHVYTVDIT